MSQQQNDRSRFITVVLALAILGTAVSTVTRAQSPSDRRGSRVYSLAPSTHGNPEGIAYDPRTGSFFVGATGDGTIYRGTLDNPTLTEFIVETNKQAAGIKVADGRLYVAGAFLGTVTVYDIATRRQVATFGGFGAGMLNDLVVTKHGDVFITDSFVPVLWHLSASQVAAGGGKPTGIPVGSEIPYDSTFNLNGIVAVRGGRSLIVVHSDRGELYRIDRDADAEYGRRIQKIAVAPLVGGDGLLIDGNDLIVVQGSPAALSFVRLNAKLNGGTIVEQRTNPSLREPSTIARAKNFYLVVNADFSTSLTPFTVTGLLRNELEEDE